MTDTNIDDLIEGEIHVGFDRAKDGDIVSLFIGNSDDKGVFTVTHMFYDKNAKFVHSLLTEMKGLREALSEKTDLLEGAGNLLGDMIDAIDKGSVDSEEIDRGDPHIPPYPFHEEWAAYVRRVLPTIKAGKKARQSLGDSKS